MQTKFIIVTAAAFMALGTVLGAFGAHALRTTLAPEALAIWQTATLYLFVNTLGLLAVGVLDHVAQVPGLTRVATLLAIGIMIFSGSLYALALTGIKALGAITPLGGLCLIAAWGLLAWQMIRRVDAKTL